METTVDKTNTDREVAQGSEKDQRAGLDKVQSSEISVNSPPVGGAATKGKEREHTAVLNEVQPVSHSEPHAEGKPAKQIEGNQTAVPGQVQTSVNSPRVEGAAATGSAQDQTAVPDTIQPCNNCLKHTTNRCSQCSSAHYCSVECQRVDWKYHKHLCAQFKDLEDRPDSGSIRALLFPDDEPSPRFVWLAKTEDPLNLDYVSDSLDITDLLGVADDRGVTQQRVMRGLRRVIRTGSSTTDGRFSAYLLVREHSFSDGSKPNMSIGMVTKGLFAFSWRGPVVAVLTSSEGSEQRNGELPFFDDIGMIDYRDLIDFFGVYGQWFPGQDDFAPESFWWLAPALKEELAQRRQIQAVKISCDVEHKLTNIKHQRLSIPEGHPAMAFVQPLAITVKLGLPLMMRRLPPDESWREAAEAIGNSNHGPGLLHLVVDPKSRHWGTAPENAVQGGVAVMRQDMKDLHPNHLQAMLAYLVQVVGPAMEDSLHGKREKGEVLEMLHPSRLDWFFRFYRKEKAGKDKDWADTPDLFEIAPLKSLMDVMDQ